LKWIAQVSPLDLLPGCLSTAYDNQTPVADIASLDDPVVGEVVTLDASASTDEDGHDLYVTWTLHDE